MALSPETLEQALKLFDTLDTDQDEVISIAEFVEHARNQGNEDFAEILERFKKYDSDGDGRIHRPEFIQAFSQQEPVR